MSNNVGALQVTPGDWGKVILVLRTGFNALGMYECTLLL